MGDWSDNLEYEQREYYGHFYDTDEDVHEEETDMSDLISRQAVEDITWEEPSYSDPLNVLTEVREKVRALPSVENKGEWIESKERSGHWYCSVCGGIHTDPETGKWREIFDYKYPFCPNCGADMRGE